MTDGVMLFARAENQAQNDADILHSLHGTATELVERFNTTMSEGLLKLDAGMMELQAELDEARATREALNSDRDKIRLLETWVSVLIEDRNRPVFPNSTGGGTDLPPNPSDYLDPHV